MWVFLASVTQMFWMSSTLCTIILILPSKTPSLASIVSLVMFTLKLSEMVRVMVLSRPMESIPFTSSVASKEVLMWLLQTVERMRSPKLLFSLRAMGQEILWTTTLPSSLMKPKASSPGIGLQQPAMT